MKLDDNEAPAELEVKNAQIAVLKQEVLELKEKHRVFLPSNIFRSNKMLELENKMLGLKVERVEWLLDMDKEKVKERKVKTRTKEKKRDGNYEKVEVKVKDRKLKKAGLE